MNRTRSLLLAAALAAVVAALVCGTTAAAQGAGPKIEQAQLQLWPEFDDPGLLVIFSGRLEGTAEAPIELSFPVPQAARDIQATFEDASGTLILRDFRLENGRLIFSVPLPNYHIEYYLDRTPSAELREIRYAFEAPYPIASLEVRVQQPARATDFAIEPRHETTAPGYGSLTDYVLQRAGLAAGERLEVVIRYRKPDNSLTSPRLVVTGPTSTAAEGAARVAASEGPAGGSATRWLPFALIGAGLAGTLIVAALYFFLYRRPRPATGRATRTSGPRKARPPRAETASPAAADFCTQCGARHRPDDRFCSQCGAPRRL